ncbi:MAG: GatB/YqeY domain-containing protein [Syntrophales bacterium]|jgi:hypothetical protein|nr:GatB/YqeY domain-containing protein [Syntrophales bacterium]MDD4338972.1 GatB/YqeY domain-containing protein [Syntrophales bacterium]HOG07576.1 GatB/YqeY domain-containing protein [Syntrophales bacterium]HOS77123.1 GatB/YqeY domain-containing protein [Syntrophales bacterium]HPB69568.1 GatB/YqeY domain-containing protein [Syntrophales bacterium]
MNFREKMTEDMVQAAKHREKIRLSTLRLIKTALHNREIDLKREMNEAEFLQMLASMVKQRRDSIEQFGKGGRADLVAQEEEELRIIQEFMPRPLSDEEIEREIDLAIDEAGAAGPKDLGKVMKILMPKLAGKADGKTVGEKVKAKLTGA